jgi:hypothetical protein
MKWKLKRTRQCAKCPWRKDVNPLDIPNGYCVDKHRALKSTIAEGLASLTVDRAMACHESHDSHCIGWLVNQIGPGNNLRLRMLMTSCENAREIQIVGKQHERFEDTLPA